jgi:O-antigen ligase
MAIVGWAQMSDFSRDRYLSLVGMGTQEETVDGRIDLMMKEFRLGFYRPIVGHGVGTTAEAKVNQLGGRSQASHNLYGQLIIETGLIGFAIFMTFVWRNFRLLQDNLRRFRGLSAAGADVSSFQIRLNRALLAVFWIYAVYSLNYFGLSQEYWYLFGGLCVAFSRSVWRSEQTLAHEAIGHPVDSRVPG